ncbi:DUF7010 family protein [Lactobacillus kimbladii]|uniref:DUF7010 family protein n=1 Tax=Lactobacillus kimbladii TaxID=1218506 RepID=UPI003AF68CA3
MTILTKNLVTFVCAAIILPLSYFVSRLINVDFQNKSNSLTELGILFLALIVGLNFEPVILALTMMGTEIVFSLALI